MQHLTTEVVVLGSGPGGYSAAFRAADLGKRVILVERYETLGGVCLNVGCIPSKTLLHVAKVLAEARQFSNHGIDFGIPQIDISKISSWKNGVVKRLTMGLKSLARQRKVEIVTGVGKFVAPKQLEVVTQQGSVTISFDQAIIAAGSEPSKLPNLPNDPRIITSTGALALTEIPATMLVVGGGVIGLEMATVYSAFGCKVTVVELMDQLVPGVDADIVKPFQNYNAKKIAQILLATKVAGVEAQADGLWVTFSGDTAPHEPQRFDKILISVGRKPNGLSIGAENAGVLVEAKGFIPVDTQMRTNVPHIFAVGDIVGAPMLAHKAVAEGRLAAEVIAGHNHHFNAKCIPSVAYTDPEIATVGISEAEAKRQGIAYGKGVFPWLASGRSLSIDRQEGVTKLIFAADSKKIIGGSIVGPNAGELIAEVALAIEMEATAETLAHTIHAHPTLSETVAMAAECFLGTVTDLYLPRSRLEQH